MADAVIEAAETSMMALERAARGGVTLVYRRTPGPRHRERPQILP
jgi:hypothetical protein